MRRFGGNESSGNFFQGANRCAEPFHLAGHSAGVSFPLRQGGLGGPMRRRNRGGQPLIERTPEAAKRQFDLIVKFFSQLARVVKDKGLDLFPEPPFDSMPAKPQRYEGVDHAWRNRTEYLLVSVGEPEGLARCVESDGIVHGAIGHVEQIGGCLADRLNQSVGPLLVRA